MANLQPPSLPTHPTEGMELERGLEAEHDATGGRATGRHASQRDGGQRSWGDSRGAHDAGGADGRGEGYECGCGDDVRGRGGVGARFAPACGAAAAHISADVTGRASSHSAAGARWVRESPRNPPKVACTPQRLHPTRARTHQAACHSAFSTDPPPLAGVGFSLVAPLTPRDGWDMQDIKWKLVANDAASTRHG